MYQTVIILLVTAAVTIITTVVTVRVTMTGRVLSQTASERFKAKAKRYGVLVWLTTFLGICIYQLVAEILSDDPLTRPDVFLIAFWTLMTFVYIVFTGVGFAVAITRRKISN